MTLCDDIQISFIARLQVESYIAFKRRLCFSSTSAKMRIVCIAVLSVIVALVECKPALDHDHREKRNVDQNDCNAVFNASSGSVTSPRYPLTYPSRSNCNTTIVAEKGTAIKVQFKDFALESHSRCKYDYVRLTDLETRKSSGNLCGLKKRGTTWTSDSNRVEIIFRSDSSVNKVGFNAIFEAVDASTLNDSAAVSTSGDNNGGDCSCGLYLYNSCLCTLAKTNPQLTRWAINNHYNTLTHIISNIGRRRRRDVTGTS